MEYWLYYVSTTDEQFYLGSFSSVEMCDRLMKFFFPEADYRIYARILGKLIFVKSSKVDKGGAANE